MKILGNYKISFSVSKNQGLFGAEHETNRQKIKTHPKNPKKYPDRTDTRTGHLDLFLRRPTFRGPTLKETSVPSPNVLSLLRQVAEDLDKNINKSMQNEFRHPASIRPASSIWHLASIRNSRSGS